MSLVNKVYNVRLRRINIGKWGSPVAKRYRIQSIPQLWLVAPSGSMTKSRGKVLKMLRFAINNQNGDL